MNISEINELTSTFDKYNMFKTLYGKKFIITIKSKKIIISIRDTIIIYDYLTNNIIADIFDSNLLSTFLLDMYYNDWNQNQIVPQ